MDLGDVMDQIGDRLDTITGLRVHRHPPSTISPPAAVVSYPEDYVYDAAFVRGMDQINGLPVIVLVGRVSDRASRDQISAYADGSGDRSVKAVLEANEDSYTAFDTIRVASVEFDIIKIADIEYLGATFSLDIAGEGSA
jgi:hypothetical protein